MVAGTPTINIPHAPRGNNTTITGMGDGAINSSIGSQWDKSTADSIKVQVTQQLKDMGIKVPPNSNIPPDLKMNVQLL